MKIEEISSKDGVSKATGVPIYDRRASLFLALGGFSIFSLGDAITKSVGAYWPGTAIAALRFFIGACGLTALLWFRQGRRAFVMPRPWIQLGRGTAMALSTSCFYMALQLMPLATATAIGFTSPLLTALLSAVLLKEYPSARVWGVIALAFTGVLLVLRPSFAELGPAALLPLLSALGMAFLMILNREAADSASPLALQMLVAVIATPILIAIAWAMHMSGLAAFHVGSLPWPLVAWIALLASTATIGHWLIYLATVRASPATIAPTNYVQILFAVAIGWVLFGDMPDTATLGGSALIILAGLWLFRPQPIRR